eukprot:CAMPEP_0206581660 /NCGR_PEP_ID=MMETSP0325_2-20121206/33982_1 /ASSEMBLY_ACC=CAM_ASM_000347 /TAXON_ID=2866 /ORGANISM="Crypthecodinium cohnii, Strain Seligo" /LENGTH=571 /DNA_ID=CAMNT_0054088115 /DNA_START=69 /DNA_END=1784 /DNA_ORIENTATION=-
MTTVASEALQVDFSWTNDATVRGRQFIQALGRCERRVPSPTAAGAANTSRTGEQEQEVSRIFHRFLDEIYAASVLKTSLGRTWTRQKAAAFALRLLVLHGLFLPTRELEHLVLQNESCMVQHLVGRLPLRLKANFKLICEQLVMYTEAASNIRKAVDGDDVASLKEVLALLDSDTGLMQDEVWKRSLIQATADISHLYSCRDSWVRSMEQRFRRLVHGTSLAEVTKQQLARVEHAVEGFQNKSKGRSKKAFVAFLADTAGKLLRCSFRQWKAIACQTRVERSLRAAREEELAQLEMIVVKQQQHSIASVCQVLARKFEEGQGRTASEYFSQWRSWVEQRRGRGGSKSTTLTADGENPEDVLAKKLAQLELLEVSKAKGLMTEFMGDNDQALALRLLQSWRQVVATRRHEREELKKARELQDALREKKDQIRRRFEMAFATSTTTILEDSFQAWAHETEQGAGARQLAKSVKMVEGRFATARHRLKGCFADVQLRAAEQVEAMLLLRCIQAWDRESKVNRIDRYYKAKLETKRKQLNGVRSLFKIFARQLEEGLLIEEDSDACPTGGTGAAS